ncbi:hypothetical protein [Aggregatibacter actinomycetemcomitans]|uniref:hypothetical protein n=1 Tax=Aggregatibacter actinomycetemcomitans TaxID=714 RepID=UPI002150DF10|nr:hypothetical protein [Aggregatibacter actinomycetemcomitans]
MSYGVKVLNDELRVKENAVKITGSTMREIAFSNKKTKTLITSKISGANGNYSVIVDGKGLDGLYHYSLIKKEIDKPFGYGVTECFKLAPNEYLLSVYSPYSPNKVTEPTQEGWSAAGTILSWTKYDDRNEDYVTDSITFYQTENGTVSGETFLNWNPQGGTTKVGFNILKMEEPPVTSNYGISINGKAITASPKQLIKLDFDMRVDKEVLISGFNLLAFYFPTKSYAGRCIEILGGSIKTRRLTKDEEQKYGDTVGVLDRKPEPFLYLKGNSEFIGSIIMIEK